MPTRIFIVPSAADRDAVDQISERLEAVVGVLAVDVTTFNHEVRVRYQRPASESQLIQEIEGTGHAVTQ